MYLRVDNVHCAKSAKFWMPFKRIVSSIPQKPGIILASCRQVNVGSWHFCASFNLRSSACGKPAWALGALPSCSVRLGNFPTRWTHGSDLDCKPVSSVKAVVSKMSTPSHGSRHAVVDRIFAVGGEDEPMATTESDPYAQPCPERPGDTKNTAMHADAWTTLAVRVNFVLRSQ